ncbi:S41 family peptidase [Blastopirellula marina]|uniref:Carboxyl-terminal processing protease n=1 Tax=Blastopirellula marina DSM 3645 TaxID=314230 RepID=A4A230_9BACT|nr:S41 family peptidase [Blastopirellula marina]EAQ77201.1 carboxyl-terminal processing protease [Blastopirellula marina DSM 3645]
MLRWTTPRSASRFVGAFLLTLILLSLVAAPAALAQVKIPDEAVLDQREITQLIADGELLEKEGRWAEALTHFEDAARAFPEVAQLKEKVDTVRRRYDVSRRYADRSFVGGMRNLPADQALSLYDDLLAKIQTNYVDSPRWSDLAYRGMLQLDAALFDRTFRQVNLKGMSEEQIADLRRQLWQSAQIDRVQNRFDVRAIALQAGQISQRISGMPATAAVLEFISGAAGSLDHYSCFLTPDQLNEVYSQIEGNFVGVGIELKTQDDALLIVRSIPGSPADKAGILDGERIVAVEGRTINQLGSEKAADMLKGVIGSSITMTIADANDAKRDVSVTRDRIEVPSVDVIKMIDPAAGVAYLRIASFQKTTTRDLTAALWSMHRQGMQALVIDLRGNPGGLLTSSVEIADLFLDQGTIVSTRGRSAGEDFDYTAHQAGTWRMPLVVLIDANSASASEIFAGAIHDNHRGTVVGERSYGKGSVQGIFPLGVANAGLRLTTAKFYSPSGQAISNRGVTPDVIVRRVAKPIGGTTILESKSDAALDAGLEAALVQLQPAQISNRAIGQR